MIDLYLKKMLSIKVLAVTLAYIGIIFFIFFLNLPDIGNDSLDYFFNTSKFVKNYYYSTTLLLRMISAVGIITLILDHDQRYLNNISCYKSRNYVFFNKLVFYTVLIIANAFIQYLANVIVTQTSSYKELLTLDSLGIIFQILIDSMIIMLVGLLIIRSKFKYFMILILIAYLFLNIYYQDAQNIIVFYIFPVFADKYQNYSNYDFYVISYIVLLTILNFCKYNFESL